MGPSFSIAEITPDGWQAYDVKGVAWGRARVMGAVANITQEGFGPSGFHAYPSALRIDGYSGDCGPGFFGHAVNTGSYLMRHPEFGWVAFGGNVDVEGETVRLTPMDAGRFRVFLAPFDLYLTLDAGTFQAVEIRGSEVHLTLSSSGTSPSTWDG